MARFVIFLGEKNICIYAMSSTTNLKRMFDKVFQKCLIATKQFLLALFIFFATNFSF